MYICICIYIYIHAEIQVLNWKKKYCIEIHYILGQSKGQPKTFDCVMALLIARVARVTKVAKVVLGWESRVDWIAWMALMSLINLNQSHMTLSQYHYPQ